MVNKDIAGIADNFINSLENAKNKLEGFSRKLDDSNSQISRELIDFESRINQLKIQIISSSDNKEINENVVTMMDSFGKAIAQWKEGIETDKEGKKFMEDHEKSMVVMVFGAVKTGKSSLGNFIAGKDWLEADIDNIYKHIDKVIFSTQEKGRDSGAIIEKNGRNWFQEGVTDTTGDIQYFTLSSLKWFDSPGTGALGKNGDKADMEQMVQKYLPYVDMCVFLINSAVPVTKSDAAYINKLTREGQEAIILYTKSDVPNERADKNIGKVVPVYPNPKPKSDEDRAMQEFEVVKALDRFGADKDKYSVMSISTKVAQCALKENDIDVFSGSNIDAFMDKMADKARSNVIELKEKRPRKILNQFIDELINGKDNGTVMGIEQIRASILPVENEINKFKSNMESRIERLVNNINRKSKASITAIIVELGKQAQANNTKIPQNVIQSEIHKKINALIESEIKTELDALMKSSVNSTENMLKNIGSPDIKTIELSKQVKHIERHYSEIKYVEREPDGLIESFFSIFGAKYHRREEIDHVIAKELDFGVNTNDVIMQIMPQIDTYTKNTIKSNLNILKESYFDPQEKYISELKYSLDQLEKNLSNLKI